tara:strand:+ start:1817 stop:2110 length:294 start_codon:yes stop_codon:yes gene_type:complete
MEIEGSAIRIRFQNVAGGLQTSDNLPPTGFTIVGGNRKLIPATATIEDDTVSVSSEDVPDPIRVRFVWGDTATSNLVDQEGLPASLFRTDGNHQSNP